jgi:hypothetical protein
MKNSKPENNSSVSITSSKENVALKEGFSKNNLNKNTSRNQLSSAKSARERTSTVQVAPRLQDNSSKDIEPPVEISTSYYYERELSGIFPMFLSTQSQNIAKCVIEQDVSLDKMFRMVPKSDLMQDMATRLAISDFTPAKQYILDYPDESMMLHYDPEYKYGQNFFLVISAETAESILNVIFS